MEAFLYYNYGVLVVALIILFIVMIVVENLYCMISGIEDANVKSNNEFSPKLQEAARDMFDDWYEFKKGKEFDKNIRQTQSA